MKKIRISDYGYGSKRKPLQNAVAWLNHHWAHVEGHQYDFDFPEYCGLPKNLRNKLQSHEVDFIQEQLNRLSPYRWDAYWPDE